MEICICTANKNKIIRLVIDSYMYVVLQNHMVMYITLEIFLCRCEALVWLFNGFFIYFSHQSPTFNMADDIPPDLSKLPDLTLLMMRPEYSRITGSIAWLLEPTPCCCQVISNYATMVSDMQYQRVLLFHMERFQLPKSSQCSELIWNGNMFYSFLNQFSTTRVNYPRSLLALVWSRLTACEADWRVVASRLSNFMTRQPLRNHKHCIS